MAKTLLQYSCLYILPFLFGMCLCGLEEERFLTVGITGQGRRVGRGRIQFAIQPWVGDSVGKSTQVILEPIEGLTNGPWPSGQTDKVSVYMKKAITGMNDDAVGEVLKEAANDLANWTDFQIRGDPSEVGGNIHWTISVLPGATTYPNIQFSASPFTMLGYMVDRDIRFMGIKCETIQTFKECILQNLAWLKMAILDNEFSKVTIIPGSLNNDSGGGYILDLTLSSDN